MAAGAATLTLLFAAGCASKPADPEADFDRRLDEYADLIDRKIEDPARAAKIKATLERLEKQYEQQSEAVQAKQQALTEAALEYRTTDAELQERLRDLEADALALRKTLQAGHFELRGLVSEKEWNEIVEHRRKVLGIF